MRTSVAILLVALASGCTASAAPADPSALYERLVGCGIFARGARGVAAVSSYYYAPDACYVQCLAEASCDDLHHLYCRSDLSLGLRCDDRCAHHCANGALIALDAVCNGNDDCGDMSDERGCRTFMCDGNAYPTSVVCDGYPQCGDGSDERNCPNSCNGSFGGIVVLQPSMRCDGYTSCGDGSDEVDCTTYTCADGRVITAPMSTPPRCNGLWECWDGSDEQDCPRAASPVATCP
jgi:hypothetical protein